MPAISATLEGVDKQLDLFWEMDDEVKGMVDLIINQGVDVGFQVMQGNTPVRTGNLLSHGFMTTSPSASLGNSCEYASYVCYGTRHMRGHDFLTPGVEAAQQAIDQGLQELELTLQEQETWESVKGGRGGGGVGAGEGAAADIGEGVGYIPEGASSFTDIISNAGGMIGESFGSIRDIGRIIVEPLNVMADMMEVL